ncbi:Na+/melibiose symporter [Lachnospiraceae bacterium NK3A20]|nr:Na+/melibiose symporter [Lachnospiraceae bacterium NK3A20]
MTKASATNKAAGKTGLNRAKPYQLVLFPFNNGATNVYYILTATYIAYYGNGVLGLALMFATTMVTVMRLFDAVTDPIIGALIDKTNGRLGKFRPFMIAGNAVMAASAFLLYFATRLIPDTMMPVRYAAYVVSYAIYVIGYTFQTSCTRSGQTVLTNDPQQRPMFTIFNLVASMIGMGTIQFFAPIIRARYGDYTTPQFFDIIIPIAVAISALLTLLAVIGIWEKDRPEYFGIAGEVQEKIKLREYLEIIRDNSPLKRLMVAGAGCKLALAIATNGTVLCMLYGGMMGNYDGLYLPMMIMGYIFSVPFFLLTVRTSQKKGQKASLMRYVGVALVMYVGVLALLLAWRQGVPGVNMSLFSMDGGFHLTLNVYSVLFIIFFGIGYGAYYATADMPIPMVADCSDYETYRSGKYVPGILGTLFSLVDKLISSLSSTVVGFAVAAIGLSTLPGGDTPYSEGMNTVVIVLFCVIPMIAWATTLIAMKGYILTGDKMKEVQAVNAARREAIEGGMSLAEAMEKFQTMDQVPEELRK